MFWYLRRRISIPFFDKTTQAHLCNLPLRNFRQCMDILALTNLSPLLALHSRSLSTRLLSTSVISPSSSRSANLESILSLHHHLGINALPGLTALSTQSGSSFSWTPPSLISIGSELVWLLMLQGASGSILPSTWCMRLFRCGFIGANLLFTLCHYIPGYVTNSISVMATLLQLRPPMLLVVFYLQSSLKAANTPVKRWNNSFLGGSNAMRSWGKRNWLTSALPDRLVKNCKRWGPDQVEKDLQFSTGMT